MKKFILFYSALFTLTGCETLNSTYTQFSQSMQDSLGGTSVLPTSSCVTPVKGFDKFYKCTLSEIVIPYNNGSSSEVYKEFIDEAKREFGSNASSSIYEFERTLTFDMLKRWYIPNDSKLQEVISNLGGSYTFQSAAYLIQECKTFDETNYRTKLENQYGRARMDEVTSRVAKAKKTCTYLTSSNTPLSNAKFYIELYQKWYLKKYVNNK